MKKIISLINVLATLLFISSCTDNDFDDLKLEEFKYEGQSNISILDLKAKYTAKYPNAKDVLSESDFMTIEEDLVIEGIVISDDKTGNFYQNLVIQDSRSGEYGGIQISILEPSLYTKFAIGQKVFIECKGLVLGTYGHEVQLGAGSYRYHKGKDGEFRLAGIDPNSISKHIFRDGMPKPELVKPLVIKISDIKPEHKFTLLKIEDVNFKYVKDFNNYNPISDKETWGNIDNDHRDSFPFKTTAIEDANGNKMDVFTSDYSKFAYKYIPLDKISITGILGAHKSNYQFIIRDLDDVKLK